MRLSNMLKICLVFWKSEPRYAYKLYAYKKKHVYLFSHIIDNCFVRVNPELKIYTMQTRFSRNLAHFSSTDVKLGHSKYR